MANNWNPRFFIAHPPVSLRRQKSFKRFSSASFFLPVMLSLYGATLTKPWAEAVGANRGTEEKGRSPPRMLSEHVPAKRGDLFCIGCRPRLKYRRKARY